MFMYIYIYKNPYLHCAIYIYLGELHSQAMCPFFLTVPSASRGFPTRLSVVIGSLGHGASGQVLRAEGATLQGPWVNYYI